MNGCGDDKLVAPGKVVDYDREMMINVLFIGAKSKVHSHPPRLAH